MVPVVENSFSSFNLKAHQSNVIALFPRKVSPHWSSSAGGVQGWKRRDPKRPPIISTSTGAPPTSWSSLENPGYVLVCVPGRRHLYTPPNTPSLPPLPPPLGMMGGTLSTAALNWDKEFQGNLPFTASGSPPRGAAGTGSPPGTCLPPCLWKIYGCLRSPWYLNTTNDGGVFARSRLERRRWRQQCL